MLTGEDKIKRRGIHVWHEALLVKKGRGCFKTVYSVEHNHCYKVFSHYFLTTGLGHRGSSHRHRERFSVPISPVALFQADLVRQSKRHQGAHAIP